MGARHSLHTPLCHNTTSKKCVPLPVCCMFYSGVPKSFLIAHWDLISLFIFFPLTVNKFMWSKRFLATFVAIVIAVAFLVTSLLKSSSLLLDLTSPSMHCRTFYDVKMNNFLYKVWQMSLRSTGVLVLQLPAAVPGCSGCRKCSLPCVHRAGSCGDTLCLCCSVLCCTRRWAGRGESAYTTWVWTAAPS